MSARAARASARRPAGRSHGVRAGHGAGPRAGARSTGGAAVDATACPVCARAAAREAAEERPADATALLHVACGPRALSTVLAAVEAHGARPVHVVATHVPDGLLVHLLLAGAPALELLRRRLVRLVDVRDATAGTSRLTIVERQER